MSQQIQRICVSELQVVIHITSDIGKLINSGICCRTGAGCYIAVPTDKHISSRLLRIRGKLDRITEVISLLRENCAVTVLEGDEIIIAAQSVCKHLPVFLVLCGVDSYIGIRTILCNRTGNLRLRTAIITGKGCGTCRMIIIPAEADLVVVGQRLLDHGVTVAAHYAVGAIRFQFGRGEIHSAVYQYLLISQFHPTLVRIATHAAIFLVADRNGIRWVQCQRDIVIGHITGKL